jgi:phosphatidylinositol alpha-1,6-mannosyltransferase
VLATDAYGGTGGIAEYTRDLIEAVANHPTTENVTVVPRVIAREPESVPERVTHLSRAAGGKMRFVGTAMRAALARPRADWIICGHINLLPVAGAAAALSGARIILIVHGIEVWEQKNSLTRLLLSRVSRVVSIGAMTIERFQTWAELPQQRMHLLPNAVDLSRYTPGAKNEALLSHWSLQGKQILLTVGRMDAAERAKGFDEVIEALPRLVAEIPNLAYIAVGEGSDRMRLEAKAAALGVRDYCVFPGYVSEAEKLDYYRSAALFVMPSRLEGFGRVFLEALATGLPVIASKLDGSREAVRDGAWGILVDPDKPEELIDAIRLGLANPTIPSRTELDYFSRPMFQRRCHDLLDSLMANERISPEEIQQRDFTPTAADDKAGASDR